MCDVFIKQSGGENIISIPKIVLELLGLKTGSSLKLSVECDRIVLTPFQIRAVTLGSLLEKSPSDKLKHTEEDTEWLNISPMGGEIL